MFQTSFFLGICVTQQNSSKDKGLSVGEPVPNMRRKKPNGNCGKNHFMHPHDNATLTLINEIKEHHRIRFTLMTANIAEPTNFILV